MIAKIARVVLIGMVAWSSLLSNGGHAQQAGVAARSSAACLAEQLAADALYAGLLEYAKHGGPPPGSMIMLGPFNDPLFQAAGWEKWTFNQINRKRESSDPGYVQRTHIEMHYMVNLATREVAQVKFKNSPEQGCVGVRVLAEGEPLGDPSGYFPPSMYAGPNLFEFAITEMAPGRVPSGQLQWNPNEVTVYNGDGPSLASPFVIPPESFQPMPSLPPQPPMTGCTFCH